MKSRLLPVLVVLVAGALAACGEDPFAVKASNPVVTDTIVVYALNGTPPDAPSGINTPFHAATRVDSSFNFDVALDLDAEGKVVVLPVSEVAGSFGVRRRVALALPATPFDSLRRAPNSGYVADSLRVIEEGQTVVVQAQSPYCGPYDASSVIYSKFVVDSVNLGTRAMYVRIVTDPNCGFLSFQPGVPNS